MISRSHLLAALAAATCTWTPAVFSQDVPPPEPQDVGEPAPSTQQDLPPTTRDAGSTEGITPGTPTETTSPGRDQNPATETGDMTSGSATTPQGDETEAMPGSGAAPTTTADTAPIEDKKIEQFADAYVAVQTIQQKAATELQSASNPEQADKVKATAESDMIAAVERTGLQVPEFNRIVERMASDTEVRSRVAAKLQERSGGSQPADRSEPSEPSGP